MFYAIYEQLKNACECIEDTFTEADVNELIDLISIATCWTQKPCETFLRGPRKEVIDLPECLDECGVVEFDPFYVPFDRDSFHFYLVEVDGVEEKFTDVTDFAYSELSGVFRVNVPLPSCMCNNYACGCPPQYKLYVEYEAGYDWLPECLLPLFCEAIQYIAEKNTCDCGECEICQTNMSAESFRIDEDGVTITDRLNYYFVTTLYEQYKKQLGLISLCGSENGLWGVVV